MGDGWETARQPARPPSYLRQEDGLMLLPGSDWAIIRLGVPGIPKEVIVDTNFFKGNFPESCLVCFYLIILYVFGVCVFGGGSLVFVTSYSCGVSGSGGGDNIINNIRHMEVTHMGACPKASSCVV